MMMASKKTRMAPRVQLFWCAMLAIYLCFQSFSCGRADRLWRISDVYENSAPVLLKPYGLAQLWYEEAAWLIRPVEDAVLVMMVSLCMAVPFLPYRTLSFLCGAGWLFLHGYEHSLTGGSHTHVLPSLCMMSLALPPREALVSIRWWNLFLLFSAGLSKVCVRRPSPPHVAHATARRTRRRRRARAARSSSTASTTCTRGGGGWTASRCASTFSIRACPCPSPSTPSRCAGAGSPPRSAPARFSSSSRPASSSGGLTAWSSPSSPRPSMVSSGTRRAPPRPASIPARTPRAS